MVISQKAVEKLKSGKNRMQFFDDDLSGFGIRIQPDAVRSFIWLAKINGKLRFRSLGKHPAVTVDQARTAAKQLNGIAAAWKATGYQGVDPFEKEKTPVRVTAPSFRELIDAYVERHVKDNANNPEKATYEANWQVKRHFEGWLDRKIDQIGLPDVLAVKNACGKRHHLANRAVEFVKAVFNWSARNREGKINFWLVDNPAKDVELYDERPRERFLQPEEMIRFEKALYDETHQDLKDFVVLSMATGARKTDVFSMKWSDVQWERATWAVPYSTKNGEAYDASLEPVAIATLQRRRKEIPDSEMYVFPGVGASGHLRDLKKPWQEFRKRAEIPDVHIHDLRRTVGSYQAIAGESLQKIAATLGHKSLQSTLVYAKLQDQAIRDAKATGQQRMREMMKSAKRRLKLTTKNRKALTI
jgi:integrase